MGALSNCATDAERSDDKPPPTKGLEIFDMFLHNHRRFVYIISFAEGETLCSLTAISAMTAEKMTLLPPGVRHALVSPSDGD